MEPLKMDDDGEYVKVDHDFPQFGIDDDDEYIKVEYTMDDSENGDGDDDGGDDDGGDDDENDGFGYEDAFNDADYKRKLLVSHYVSLPKAMELKDLVKDIVLPYLPAKSLARFRSVSKEWDEWAKSPFLCHQQSYYFKALSGFFCQSYGWKTTFITLDKTAYGIPTSDLGSFLPEEGTLLSSCNGLLVCKGCNFFGPYYVCNPATQEWTTLPSPTLYNGFEVAVVLAFEPSALNMEADYHLLRLFPANGCFYFDIFSSKTNSWEVAETVLVTDEEGMKIKDNAFYMKGVVYMETSTRSVIAFDLFSELYEVISLPDECPHDGVLTQIRGELCYVGIMHPLFSHEYDIVVYSGMDLSLKSRVKASIKPKSPGKYRVLSCLDGENAMVVVDDMMMYSCSTSDGSVKVVTSVEISSAASVKFVPYVNSLVQVKRLPLY